MKGSRSGMEMTSASPSRTTEVTQHMNLRESAAAEVEASANNGDSQETLEQIEVDMGSADGATFAGMDESTGQVNTGLIEYAPDDVETEVNRRYARDPELREELYGEEVGLLVTRRSEVDEDYAERVADASDETRDMMWYTVVNEVTGETLEPVEGEPVGYSFLEWRFDPTAGNLPDQDYEFVQEYIDAGAPTDEDTILDNIEQNTDQLSDDPNTERMVGLIQNMA